MLDTYGDFLTVEETVEVLKISKTNLYRLIKDCEITSYKIGHKYIIHKDDLISYINSSMTQKRRVENLNLSLRLI